MSYQTYRFAFADETAFLDYLEAAIPTMHVAEETDPETGDVITERGYVESSVLPVRKTLQVVDPDTGDVVRTLEGEVVGRRVAQLHVLGEDVRAPVRDADGEIVTETVTGEDGEPYEQPVLETVPGYLVDLVSNVEPETAEQLVALADAGVTPDYPVRRYGHELAA